MCKLVPGGGDSPSEKEQFVLLRRLHFHTKPFFCIVHMSRNYAADVCVLALQM